MFGVKKEDRNLRKANCIGRIPFWELCYNLCVFVEKKKTWGLRHVSEMAENMETQALENILTKLGRCCGCTCFNFCHQWFSVFFFFSVCIGFYFFFRNSLEKSCTHTIRGKTSLKFQNNIYLELNPSFSWSRGRESCDLNCKNQLKWLMSFALAADVRGPVNVNQACSTDKHPQLTSLPSCATLSAQSDAPLAHQISFHVPCLITKVQETGMEGATPSTDSPRFMLKSVLTQTSDRNSLPLSSRSHASACFPAI